MMLFILCVLGISPAWSIIIEYPQAVEYQHMTAAFGPATYDVSGHLVLAEPSQYCPKFTDGSGIEVNGSIVIILRGNCSFVDKTYLAQLNGAVGVIVGDNQDESLLQMGSQDGDNSSKIVIPSVFISQTDYNQILKLAKYSNITMAVVNATGEVSWSLESPWVEMAYWTLPIVGLVVVMGLIYLIRKHCLPRVQRSQRFDVASRMPLISFRSDDETKTGSTSDSSSTRLVHNESCAICLEDFTEGDKVKVLPCKHGFHSACIDPWLNEKSDLCPICKTSIFSVPLQEPSYWRRCIHSCV
eukprot:TRINITY_DN22043_c0_g1_i15.p1 TRINITY_DN22043_c0_g1~~TRINITY_DN22043_c0_g1_i15.p1  ORF type:complete len:299 (-),score=16.37 TRINITY_DN22043_c0_g1_i15:78-974(-)